MYPHQKPLTDIQEAYIHNLYYNRKMYVGLVKLFNYIRENKPNTIPHLYRAQIEKWLISQKIYQLFKKPQKQKATRQIYSSKKAKLFQIDLIDFCKKPSGDYRYILMVIDTFARKLFAKALTNKTAENVSKNIKLIFNENNIKPTVIQTDNGKEFSNLTIEAMHIKSNSYTPQNQSIVERVNQTIKRMIYKYIKITGEDNWEDILDEIVNNYNNTTHNLLKQHQTNYTLLHLKNRKK